MRRPPLLAVLFCLTASFARADVPLQGGGIAGRLVLSVVTADAGAFGFGAAVPDDFEGSFRIALDDPPPPGEPIPNGDYPGTFVSFEVTIGDTSWDASMPHGAPLVRFVGGQATGVFAPFTDTLPEHPDLHLLLPASPGAWEALDDDGASNNGSITGTYQLLPAAPAPALGGWGRVALSGSLLIAAAALLLAGRRRSAAAG